jgi:hypothetical protein
MVFLALIRPVVPIRFITRPIRTTADRRVNGGLGGAIVYRRWCRSPASG